MTTMGSKGGGAQGLVDRIGGPERLRELLESFYERLATDLLVGFFFAGRDLPKIIDGQFRFLMRTFGAAKEFDGKHPGVAHDDLPPILAGHFDRRLKVLNEVLEAGGVEPRDRAAWLRVENGFRRAIVGSEPHSTPPDPKLR